MKELIVSWKGEKSKLRQKSKRLYDFKNILSVPPDVTEAAQSEWASISHTAILVCPELKGLFSEATSFSIQMMHRLQRPTAINAKPRNHH